MVCFVLFNACNFLNIRSPWSPPVEVCVTCMFLSIAIVSLAVHGSMFLFLLSCLFPEKTNNEKLWILEKILVDGHASVLNSASGLVLVLHLLGWFSLVKEIWNFYSMSLFSKVMIFSFFFFFFQPSSLEGVSSRFSWP